MIDELYAAFCGTLPPRLKTSAEGLSHELGLTPSAAVPWSEVFGHEVTLGAPGLFAEAMPSVAAGKVMDAVLAHMLAVIEAFGTDRIEDGQITPSRDLTELLERLREARDAALLRVAEREDGGAVDGRSADRITTEAIAQERAVLLSGAAVTMAEYESISAGKQRVGYPASVALARAAGWSARQQRAVADTLTGVWLGLQMQDDVVDWKDDQQRGGSWAMAIAKGLGPVGDESDAASIVHASGALVIMLRRSRYHYRSARRRARALGARRLEAWAGAREKAIIDLAASEAESPGFVARAQALSAWAREVLG